MKKTAIYLRTSTDMQANGLDSQRRALEEYCKQKGLNDFIVFEDFGVSGAKQSRPGLDKLMQAARINEIDKVIVYSFSRFARSTKHLIIALEEFDKHSIAFISITENIDTSTALGRTIYQIIASISELERALIAERVRNGLKAAKARGRRLGAIKRHANVEPFIELRKSGMSIRQIARTLKCSPMTVSRCLRKTVSLLSDNDTKPAVT